jgi:hypothetical protein
LPQPKLKTPSKIENFEQNGNTDETGKHQAKWENIDHNGLAPSKKAKLRAKLAKLANICAL